MMVLLERDFVADVCADMIQDGWLYDPEVKLCKNTGFVVEDLVGWMQDVYPNIWGKLSDMFGQDASDKIAVQFRNSFKEQGTLRFLHRPIEFHGTSVDKYFTLMQAKDSGVMSDVDMHRYNSNRLRILKEVRYSPSGEGRLDLILTVNGIPVVTAEFKCDRQQSVKEAIRQYREDRVVDDVHPSMLLSSVEGALVHFAVSDKAVYVCGCLSGKDSEFLPFNPWNTANTTNGLGGGKYVSDYLWKYFWSKDVLLNILCFFVAPNPPKDKDKDEDKVKKDLGWIFPRYHQFDLVQKALESIRLGKLNERYLIQHSAGSGKTKTIGWLAHALAREKNVDNRYVYDGIIVLSDREVIDRQLQDELKILSASPDIVTQIESKSESKGSLLSDALQQGKRIIVCTIQSFKYISDEITSIKDGSGRYAILADEAHSSQAGTTAIKVRETLGRLRNDENNVDADDVEYIDTQDAMNDSMSDLIRFNGGVITFFAFTATPKAQTLELFGTVVCDEEADDYKYQPFHVYSMNQAIEEKFILDVLKNYTTYDTYARVALLSQRDQYKKANDSVHGVASWVRKQLENIDYRARSIVGHYVGQIRPMLHGEGKAMVVVSRRDDAVRMALALDVQAKAMGLSVHVMVAFSGPLTLDGHNYTEDSVNKQLGAPSGNLPEVFEKTGHILVVANKYQTGFDQPLLCGMYIDKKLDGIQAVQTLSRLNRRYPGKDGVFVLDFVNKMEDMVKSFAEYYEVTELLGGSDPDIFVQLRHNLLEFWGKELDVTGLGNLWIESAGQSDTEKMRIRGEVISSIDRVVGPIIEEWEHICSTLSGMDPSNTRFLGLNERLSTLLSLRNNMNKYVSMYQFFTQIYKDKNSIFYRDPTFGHLYIILTYMLPRLRFPALNGSVDASALLMHDYRLHKLEESSPDLLGLSVGLSPKYPTVVDKTLVLEGESQALDISKDMGQLLEEFHKCFASLNNDRSISPERLELFMRAVHDGLESTDVDVSTGEVSRDVLLQDIRMRLLRSMQDFSAFCTYFLGSPENLAAFERMIAMHSSVKSDASDI